jgi:cobaltochelatase CobS
MADGKVGRWTVNGRCAFCGVATAWVQRADRTYGRPHCAALGSDGRPLFRTVGGKRRPMSTGVTHHCERSDREVMTGERAAALAAGKASASAAQAATGTASTALDADFDASAAHAGAQAATQAAGAVVVAGAEAVTAVEAAARLIRAEVMAQLGRREVVTHRIVDQAGRTIRETATDETFHPGFDRIVALMAQRRHTYLLGPAGSGKTYLAQQAATHLGLKCMVQPCGGLSVARLIGAQTAAGGETDTPFSIMWREGGCLILDEFHSVLPSVALALNSQLANGTWVQRNQAIRAHADFVVVANGNGDLRGASDQYVAGQQLDLATVSRFAFLEIGYDDAFETTLVTRANPDALPMLEWLRALRARLASDNVLSVLVGPRESQNVALDLANGASVREALDSWIWRGYPKDDVRRLESAVGPLPKLGRK